MSRSPRRTVRVQPPLRGRLAAVASPEQRRKYSEPVVRQRPLVSKSLSKSNFRKLEKPDSNDLNEFEKRLVVLIILILVLLLIGSLF